MTDASKSLLGKTTDYSNSYSPSLLFPLERAENRRSLAMPSELPFQGEDVWTGYELSWLNMSGKPVIALAEFHFPADSTYMIESKSFKLYLNSFNHEQYETSDALKEVIEKDLSDAVGMPVSVHLMQADTLIHPTHNSQEREYELLDTLDIAGFEYQPNADLLALSADERVSKRLCSHLLRSNCPVTGQPDWASLYIEYSGPEIDDASLLRYVVSFRECQDFHEHCVERIFIDLRERCQCVSLSVYARYTRRGGLDINPYRASLDMPNHAPLIRTIRQ